MISVNNRDFLHVPITDYIIPSEKVAHVQVGNNAEHALLVLTKTGYSAIPVIDSKNHLRGLLGIGMITDSILGLERIEYERLSDLKVDDIMQTDLPTIKTTDKFQKGLDLLINHTFLCVTEEDGTFAGILTRRVMLKEFKKYIYTK
ncbi:MULTISPECIES: cyclic-di-AMP-binding protein CbpB [Sporosarcina]|uniref:Cyclic-di-AMP-binding protein CbpB n=1 Tax=Sporosarcina saromensis TaxID=359365 RepID=A0ABU4G4Q1_9BACL|nr:cyclic-di-AMP-binding protein CbpB [Sporosarcina saromensis]MDW0111948.1 cyclic-di-AMP-binding protein CbpB [Sporosarcina saromensis]